MIETIGPVKRLHIGRWAFGIAIVSVLVSIIGLFSHAYAHEQRPAIATLAIDQDQSLQLSISTNIEAIIAQIGPEHEDTDDSPNSETYRTLRALAPDQLEMKFNQPSQAWKNAISVTIDGEPVSLEIVQVVIPEDDDVARARISEIKLSGSPVRAGDVLQWSYPAQYGASVIRLERPNTELVSQFLLPGTPSDEFAIKRPQTRSTFDIIFEYISIGYVHIIPEGLDHILFVLGLFFLSTRWKPLIAQVTLFTVAHTVTLALGLLGIVRLSPNIVEPLIALSIVYVAIENLFTQSLKIWRSFLVFGFGLLHGLGFAGILMEIGMPPDQFVLGLIAFNVGVELGQLSVIAIALVGFWFALKKLWYRKFIAMPASLVIVAIGLYWFVERII